MLFGILITVAISVLIFLAGFATLYFAWNKKGVNKIISRVFGIIMMEMGCLYILGSIPALLTQLGKIDNMDTYYVTIVSAALFVDIFISFLFSYKFTRNIKISYFVAGLFALYFIYFTYFILTKGGVVVIGWNYFTYDFQLEKYTKILFAANAIPLIIVGVIDFIRSSLIFSRNDCYQNKIYFFYSLSFVVGYSPSAIIPIGFLGGWMLALNCVIMTAGILIGAYAGWLKEEKEEYIPSKGNYNNFFNN